VVLLSSVPENTFSVHQLFHFCSCVCNGVSWYCQSCLEAYLFWQCFICCSSLSVIDSNAPSNSLLLHVVLTASVYLCLFHGTFSIQTRYKFVCYLVYNFMVYTELDWQISHFTESLIVCTVCVYLHYFFIFFIPATFLIWYEVKFCLQQLAQITLLFVACLTSLLQLFFS